jgi:hypothetical protein
MLPLFPLLEVLVRKVPVFDWVGREVEGADVLGVGAGAEEVAEWVAEVLLFELLRCKVVPGAD